MGCVLLLVCVALPVQRARAEEPNAVLTLDAAIRLGMVTSPELMAIRQQHGIAAAGLVIARTYPFNPVLESKVRAVSGPESAGITNRLSNEHKVFMDVEIKGQQWIRQEIANAVISRTEWEITTMETAQAVRVARAYDTAVYRREKQKLYDFAVKENTKAADLVKKLVDARQLKLADLLTIRTEVADFTLQRQASQAALVMAYRDLDRAIGLIHEDYQLGTELLVPTQPPDVDTLLKAAMEHRPDLHARRIAVTESEGRLRLEIANRYGNPNMGPAYEYNETRCNFIGAQLTLPLPVFNTHQGEIQQREAELGRAKSDLHQTEIQIQQDIYAAVDRIEQARALVDLYRKQIMPDLDKALVDIRKLFELQEPGVDVLRLIDVQRKQLRARDGELDAILELRQALNDLAAAVGDPSIAITGKPAP